MRSTDDMLSETSGPAYDNDFASVYENRKGEKKITPGYMKSLCEDGFRSYGAGGLTFVNCTAKNMRGGFELRTRDARLENCEAISCERGFWIGSDSKVTNCRGNAEYGPLLYVEGRDAKIEMELLPAESDMTVHALAAICGMGHQITILITIG